jgi:hypothetical protein
VEFLARLLNLGSSFAHEMGFSGSICVRRAVVELQSACRVGFRLRER